MQANSTSLGTFAFERLEKESLNFACQKHKRKNISYICTEQNCDNRLLCSDCLLSDHLIHIQTKKIIDINDFIEENKFLLDPQKKINDAIKELDQTTKKTKQYVENKLEKLKQNIIEIINKMKKNCDITLEVAREEEILKLKRIQSKIVMNNESVSPRKISTVFEFKTFLENLFKKRIILEENSIFEKFEKFYKDLQTSQEYIRKNFTTKLEALVQDLQQVSYFFYYFSYIIIF